MSIRFWQGVVLYTLSVKVILVAHCKSGCSLEPPGQVGTPHRIIPGSLSAAQNQLQFTFS